MMIAAVYARKSTEQNGIADDQKSVARQIEHARHYAERKGWIIADDHVYVDDGISGAEFANRPRFLRLMNAVKPQPPFQVLVMSEESRLGREAIETAYALKQLVTAGVRVFFYLWSQLSLLPCMRCKEPLHDKAGGAADTARPLAPRAFACGYQLCDPVTANSRPFDDAAASGGRD